jgi:CheY-specific phosphatase CheX
MSILKVSETPDATIVNIESTSCDATVGSELLQLAMKTMQQPQKLFVLDMHSCVSLESQIYPLIRNLHQFLRKQVKHLVCLHVAESLVAQMTQDGIADVFSPVASLDAAKRKLAPKADPGEFLSKFLGSVVKNTVKVFQIQCNMALTPEKPAVRSLEEKDEVSIAGVISMTSSVAECTIALCFTKEAFLETYASMFSEEVTVITDEMRDAAAELLNIIYGQTKIELNNIHGMDIQKSVPSVVFGSQLILRNQNTQKMIVVPLAAKNGKCFIQISI